MELMENHHLRDSAVLHRYIRETNSSVLIIDEVQDITDWEEVIASLLARGGVDVFLSGSNASMLSTDLASKITGR